MSQFFSVIGGYFNKNNDEIDKHHSNLDESIALRNKEINELMQKSQEYHFRAKQSLALKNKAAAARFLKLKKETEQEIELEQGKIQFLLKEKKKFKSLQKNEDIIKLSKQSRDLYEKKHKETNGEEDFSEIMADLELQHNESNEVDEQFLLQAERDKNEDLDQEIDADLADLESELEEDQLKMLDQQMLSQHVPVSSLRDPVSILNKQRSSNLAPELQKTQYQQNNGHNNINDRQMYQNNNFNQNADIQYMQMQQQLHQQKLQQQQTHNANISNSMTYGQYKNDQRYQHQKEKEEEKITFEI